MKRDQIKASELQSKFGLFFGMGNSAAPVPVGGSAVPVRSTTVPAVNGPGWIVPMDPNVKAVNELLRRCMVVP